MYNLGMRTTLTLDDDVAARLAEIQKKTGRTFKEVTNDTLRAGLERGMAGAKARRPRFKVKARKLGLRPGLSYDNIGELLEQLEGPAR
jgi:hypothetical protein